MVKKNPRDSSSSDIFQLLLETAEKERKQRREELLAPLGVKEFFVDGDVTIDKRTCKGVECKLCIKACPTNALFWKAGEVGITRELCIYCGACVLNCIVDDCIKVSRKRANGEVEKFSTPRGVTLLQNSINAKKRLERVKSIFPTLEEYLRRYKPSMAA
ncbi:MAG: 4Fe-4S dicluster domain-containing protein [Candidatus Bathyarchaeales archaeon]